MSHMAPSRLSKFPAVNVALVRRPAQTETRSSLTTVRDFGQHQSHRATHPLVTAIDPTPDDAPQPVRAVLVPSISSNLPHTEHEVNESMISAPASHSRNWPVSSTPASSEPDSASWSIEEDSTVSSGDDLPPTRRPPFRNNSSTFPFGARRDNYQSSGSWLPRSGFSSRHSQVHLQSQVGHIPGPESESGSSDNGPAGLSAEEELQELWAKLDGQRRNVKDLRAEIAEKRRETHRLGHRKDEVDNAFMQLIRPHLTTGQRMVVVPADVMGKRFGDMQRIRDDYYSAQTLLESLEADMDNEERELQNVENDVFRLLYDRLGMSHEDSFSERQEINEWRNQGVVDDDGDDDNDDAASRITLLGISADLPQDIHPLYSELLEAIGDRDEAREHYDEIRNHRQVILHGLEMKLHRERSRSQGNLLSEEELKRLKSSLAIVPTDGKSFKAQFGVSIAPENLQFLQTFGREEAKVRQRLAEASKNVDRLRDLCIKKGVMRKHAPYNEEYTIFSGTNRATLHLDGNMTIDEYASTSHGLTHPKFPILVSNPTHILELTTAEKALEKADKLSKEHPTSTTFTRRTDCIKEVGISNLMTKVTSKPDFINQWLIHRLRTCTLEAERMLSVAEDNFRVENIRAWQGQVLYFWRRDDAANISPSEFHGPMTPRDELDVEDDSELAFNSVIAASTRARSEDVNLHRLRDSPRRSAQSLG